MPDKLRIIQFLKREGILNPDEKIMVKVNNEDTRPTSVNLILVSLRLIFSRFLPTMNAEFSQNIFEVCRDHCDYHNEV